MGGKPAFEIIFFPFSIVSPTTQIVHVCMNYNCLANHRVGSTHFSHVVVNLDISNALLININVAQVPNMADLITRSTMIHSGRVEMSKSIGTVITKITLSVNVETVEAWIESKNSAVDLCLEVLMGIKKMHLPSYLTIAVPSKRTNSIKRQACPDKSNKKTKTCTFFSCRSESSNKSL